MPVQVTHPGVYIDEIPSINKTVPAVSTSTAAFVDFFGRGPMSDKENAKAVQIFNLRDFDRKFGGLHLKSEASYAITQFFNNGGQNAFVVRCNDGNGKAAEHRVKVTVPYLANFARDAAEAANKATGQALSAQGVVGASVALAAVDKAPLPKQAPAAALATVAKELENPKLETHAHLSGARGMLRRVIDALKDALENAKKAGTEDDDARRHYATACAKFDAVDLRDSTAELKPVVAKAIEAAKAAAAKVIEICQPFDTYPPQTKTGIGKSIESAREALGAVTRIFYLTGFGAAAASAEHLDDSADAADKNIVGRIDTVLSASQFGIARAKIHVATSEDKSEFTAVQTTYAEAVFKRKDIDAAGEDAKAAVTASAMEAARAAAAAVDTLVQRLAGTGCMDPLPKNAAALAQAISGDPADDKDTGVHGDLGKAQAAHDGLGDEPAVDALTAAIRQMSDALAAVRGLKVPALKLIPNDPDIKDDWPPVAKAAEVASDLALEAANATRAAADAAEAAGKILSERLLQAEAAGGTIATQTRAAAEAAARGAGVAGAKAKAAAEHAESAAKLVRINPEGNEQLENIDAKEEVMSTIAANAEAAEAAAEAAGEASDKAMDAHLAALAAGEAGGDPAITISAISPGIWGNQLQVVVQDQLNFRFSIVVRETKKSGGKLVTVSEETFPNLTLQDEDDTRFAIRVVNHESLLVQIAYKGPVVSGTRPEANVGVGGTPVAANFQALKNGADGDRPTSTQLIEAMTKALDEIAPEVFTLLCLPITATYSAAEAGTANTKAMNYCAERRAFMIVDIPESVRTVDQMKKWMGKYGNAMNFHAATYFPRLTMPDPLQRFRPRNVGPSGTMAGIYARTDTRRGIWKAPAGIEAVIQGAQIVARVTDEENGQLNPLGANVLRSFPIYGNICWGARTLAGADAIQSEWKYLNVRRLVSYIEESLFQALKWAVFESNNEDLWRAIRQQVGKFLAGLYASGAFAGGGPEKCFFVHCDETTTTPTDIEQGRVNIAVGIAPVKPAEFVVVHIQQMTRQE